MNQAKKNTVHHCIHQAGAVCVVMVAMGKNAFRYSPKPPVKALIRNWVGPNRKMTAAMASARITLNRLSHWMPRWTPVMAELT